MKQTVYLEKLISEMLVKNNLRVTFSVEEATEVRLTNRELESALADVNSRLKLKLKKGICSQVLKEQLALHNLQLGEKFGDSIHVYHYQTILDTIETNENGHATYLKGFTRNKFLKDYKHIHHNSSTYIQKNVSDYWKKKCKGQNEVVFQNELLNAVYLNLLKTQTPDFARQKCLSVLLNKIHDECIFREFKDKTGEWIICVFHKDRWIYLCLATHKEGDDSVVERIQRCFEEFPELKKG